MINDLLILRKHGWQFVPDLRNATLSPLFRGRPRIARGIEAQMKSKLAALCPSKAITSEPFSLDLGRCVFCRECEWISEGAIQFLPDFRTAVNRREDLILYEGADRPIRLQDGLIRPEIRKLFSGALKLRQVSAGGDNACEMELNAAGNVNFDMGRFGIQFVASPRHADGLVLTGPVSQNMAKALQMTWEAIPDPKILVLAGTDAISGGMLAQSGELNRSFLDSHNPDLMVPGNPCHPLSFINGILDLTRGTESPGK